MCWGFGWSTKNQSIFWCVSIRGTNASPMVMPSLWEKRYEVDTRTHHLFMDSYGTRSLNRVTWLSFDHSVHLSLQWIWFTVEVPLWMEIPVSLAWLGGESSTLVFVGYPRSYWHWWTLFETTFTSSVLAGADIFCAISSMVRIRRCQRCGPGSIPG